MTMNYRLTQNSQFTTNFLQDKVTVMTDCQWEIKDNLSICIIPNNTITSI